MRIYIYTHITYGGPGTKCAVNKYRLLKYVQSTMMFIKHKMLSIYSPMTFQKRICLLSSKFIYTHYGIKT